MFGTDSDIVDDAKPEEEIDFASASVDLQSETGDVTVPVVTADGK